MDVLSQLSAEMAELLEGFKPHAIVGNTTFGLTNYIVYYLVAAVVFLIVCFRFKKKQSEMVADCMGRLRQSGCSCAVAS